MKKLTVLIVVFVCLAALVRGLAQRPSTLEVTVRLAEGLPDLTPPPRMYVGFVPDGSRAKPTLGNIALIQPKEGTESIYEVPPNRSIGIFLPSRGVAPFQSTVSVKPRQHLRHDFILDAGIVRVTSEHRPNAGRSPIRVLDADGQFKPNNSYPSGIELLVPASSRFFQVGEGLRAKQESINVIAGQTQHLNIVSETGSLTIDIDSVIPFEELSPTPVLRAEQGSNLLYHRNGTFDAGRWQFGSYETWLELPARFRFPIRSARVGPINVEIDQLDNSMTIPLSLVGVDVQFDGWEDTMPEYATAFVVSIDEPGLPFATYRVTDNRAPLIFFPPEEMHDYAIALVANNEVHALQVVGALPADNPQEVTVVPGGDAALCAAIVRDFDCSSLSE